MPALTWDEVGKHFYETGVHKVALSIYDSTNNNYGTPVAWNGVTSIQEASEGADANAIYADNIKYLNLRGVEEFGFTIEAYTYPDAWEKCDGLSTNAKGVTVGQQSRAMFGLAYITQLGNDEAGSEFGEKIHIIYGATASPTERGYETINDSPEAITFSWECDTTPIDMTALGAGLKPASLITVSQYDHTGTLNPAYAKVYDLIYGTTPTFPLPSAIATAVNAED